MASVTPKPTIVFRQYNNSKPTNGIFSDPVMNFMSCVALTGQVTKTKTKKAKYFEGANYSLHVPKTF